MGGILLVSSLFTSFKK